MGDGQLGSGGPWLGTEFSVQGSRDWRRRLAEGWQSLKLFVWVGAATLYLQYRTSYSAMYTVQREHGVLT